jgi:hypothetical protein
MPEENAEIVRRLLERRLAELGAAIAQGSSGG